MTSSMQVPSGPGARLKSEEAQEGIGLKLCTLYEFFYNFHSPYRKLLGKPGDLKFKLERRRERVVTNDNGVRPT